MGDEHGDGGGAQAWHMRNGGRVASLKVGKLCCLLTVTPLLGQGTALGRSTRGPAPEWDTVFLLDCETGLIWSVHDALERGFG